MTNERAYELLQLRREYIEANGGPKKKKAGGRKVAAKKTAVKKAAAKKAPAKKAAAKKAAPKKKAATTSSDDE
jgi:topoisomerase IA-like protein